MKEASAMLAICYWHNSRSFPVGLTMMIDRLLYQTFYNIWQENSNVIVADVANEWSINQKETQQNSIKYLKIVLKKYIYVI